MNDTCNQNNCNFKKRVRPNEKLQQIISLTFLPIIIAGFYLPWLGFSIFACMIAGLILSIKKGRKWCDWLCPRGSFLDIFLTPFSPQKKLPKWFYSYQFRISFIIGLFSFLAFNIYLAWPNISAIGFAFVKTLTITTVISIVLGVFFRARAWCVLCPVGTFSGIIGNQSTPIKIDFGKCLDCTNCERVCPMGLAPYKYKKEGLFQNNDCIKCKTCMRNCPVGALRF